MAENKIQGIIEKYNLSRFEKHEGISHFDNKKQVTLFEMQQDDFENFIKFYKPQEIYYKELNGDDIGTYSVTALEVDDKAEIYSHTYIWGYLGIWNTCEGLG